ncbi:unnamed protein product [Lymnaea stagnalis]|uniref:Solute carrier family 13 member 5 n=1 Tax=Lymnaea stagnalis TaxID=6523 RepID=A0AAV2I4U4_LYMST
MAVYWITEALPVGVTALLPVFFFPIFQIVNSNEIAAQYMNDINMLFLGGLIMATAIEYWELHRRVALGVLMIVGTEPKWLMLGMMLATWFLSMWISNTATTAMMIPIADAVLVQLKGSASKQKGQGEVDVKIVEESNGRTGEELFSKTGGSPDVQHKPQISIKAPPDPLAPEVEAAPEVDDPAYANMGKAMSLCICYAATCGGIACLTGTGPNLAFKAHADYVYAQYGLNNPVTFGNWMAFGIPLSLLTLFVCWAWLLIAFLRCRGACGCCSATKHDAGQAKRIKQVIRDEYAKLGPLVFGQLAIIFLFVALVTLWITRDLGGVTGWGTSFNMPVKDGAVAMLIAVLLFAVPSTLPFLKSYSDPAHPEKWAKKEISNTAKQETIRFGPIEVRPLLNWKVTHEKLPWHLFLLLGGGYALSKGCEKSGLSSWIGHQLEFFTDWNQWGIIFIIGYITAAATEVTSNTAIATLLLPIMSQLAINTGVHPLYYMLPTALASSFAFMLPVATPPNAIVFAYGRITIADMAKIGFVLNILAIPCLVAVIGTIGDALYDFDNIPVEFLKKNLTTLAKI